MQPITCLWGYYASESQAHSLLVTLSKCENCHKSIPFNITVPANLGATLYRVERIRKTAMWLCAH